jgi:hypothetical protein
VAAIACAAVPLGVLLPSTARAATAPTTPTTPGVSNLQQAPGLPGAPPLPAACNLSWPTSAWPPRTDAEAEAHALRQSDLPAGLRVAPPFFASNGPNLDQLAVGWPQAGIAELDTSSPSRAGSESSIDEIVGRAQTPAQATATYRRARDVIFGSCAKAWPGHEGQMHYPIPWAGAGAFAFEQSDQQDHGVGSVSVTLFGHQGRFDFVLQVGDLTYTPNPSQRAAPPPRAELVGILRSARARLGTH